MSKSVDFSIKETIPLGLTTGIIGSILNATVTYPLFYDEAPYIYYMLASTIITTPIFAIALLIAYYKSNRSDALPCYIFAFLLSISPYYIFFIAGGLISSLTTPPIPPTIRLLIFIALIIYISISIKRSSSNILAAAQKNNFIEKAYIIQDGKQLLKYKEMKRLDETVEKNIFSFTKEAGKKINGIKIAMIGMAAMLGGLYNIFPSPNFIIKLSIAYACFFITPFMIFTAVHVYYVQYKFPKMIFAEKWYKTCRETN